MVGRQNSPEIILPMADTQQSGGRRGEAEEGGARGVLEKLIIKKKPDCQFGPVGSEQSVWKSGGLSGERGQGG